MNVQIAQINGFTLAAVQGRLDTITSGDFEAIVIPLVEPGSRFVIDCSDMDYISSTGLRVFLMMQKKVMGGGGQLRLCGLQPSIREIFDIAGFSGIFAIFPDRDSATSN